MNNTYSSQLTVNSSMYARTQLFPSAYFFEVIRINVSTEGVYRLYSSDSGRIYKYLYNNNFTASNPLMNLLCADDYSCWYYRFPTSISTMLRPGVYFLVVTTYEFHSIGPFSVDVHGPRGFIMERFNLSWNSSKSSLLKQGT
jgi:hypothetical protein